MDNLKQVCTRVAAVGEDCRQLSAYLQAASRQAQQMSREIHSTLHLEGNQTAEDICALMNSAAQQMMTACYGLMNAWNEGSRWCDQHTVSGPTAAPSPGGSTSAASPMGRQAAQKASDQITMSAYARISTPHSARDDLKNTNPKWRPNSPWDINCQRCVSAYEARRRGYDVTAAPLTDDRDTLQCMRHPNGWASVYQGAELIDCTSNSGTGSEILVDEQMAQWGDGARAIVRVRWKLGGGHVFIAERVNGKTWYIDPQRGTENVNHYFQQARGDGTYCVRIDNLCFTERIHDCVNGRAA